MPALADRVIAVHVVRVEIVGAGHAHAQMPGARLGLSEIIAFGRDAFNGLGVLVERRLRRPFAVALRFLCFRLRLGHGNAEHFRMGDRHALHLDHRCVHAVGGHFLRDHLRHVLQLLAREAEVLQAVERQVLQLARIFRYLVRHQVRLELLEDVLRHRALLQVAREVPRLAQARERHAIGYVGVGGRLLVGRKVQVHAEHQVARSARFGGPRQIIGGIFATTVAPVGRIVFVHGPTSSLVFTSRFSLTIMAWDAGVARAL